MFKNFLYIVLNPLFCALTSCRSEGVFIDFIYNSTDSYNYYYELLCIFPKSPATGRYLSNLKMQTQEDYKNGSDNSMGGQSYAENR